MKHQPEHPGTTLGNTLLLVGLIVLVLVVTVLIAC